MDQSTALETPPRAEESAHKTVSRIASSAAGCALAAFAFGALLDAPWPGAIAACGISLMGVGVAWVLPRR